MQIHSQESFQPSPAVGNSVARKTGFSLAHQQLEWLNGGVLTMLLDGLATDGQLMIGCFSVDRGKAPFHTHQNEDEIFMLLAGTALLWHGEEEYELHACGHGVT